MTTAFLLNGVILASLVTLVAMAIVPLLRGFGARGAYVFAVFAFFAAAIAPFAMPPASRAPASTAAGAEIAIREDLSAIAHIWMAGLFFLLAREALAHTSLLQSTGRPLTGEERSRLDVPPEFLVQVIEGVTPMSAGLLRPRILLSPETLEQPTAVTRAVIAHEIAHVRWRDPLVHALIRAVRALLWPVFPLWALERLVRREREAAADAAAVANLDADALCSYAEAMLTSARRGSGVAALGISESDLEHRVRRLFRERRVSVVSIAASLGMLTIAAAALTLAPPVRFRPQSIPLTVARAAIVESSSTTRLVEHRREPNARRRPAAERVLSVAFGSSFSDLYSQAPEPVIHRQAAEAVHAAVHEHRADPPKDRITETVVIRYVWREVIRIRN